MYPNILLSVLIALIALTIIGRMVNSPSLVQSAGVLMVAGAAVALILWLLWGYSPVPHWFPKLAARLAHTVARAAHR
jgi:hypothetical protein